MEEEYNSSPFTLTTTTKYIVVIIIAEGRKYSFPIAKLNLVLTLNHLIPVTWSIILPFTVNIRICFYVELCLHVNYIIDRLSGARDAHGR